MISLNHILAGEITEFIIHGDCDVDEVVAVIEGGYAGSTKGVLWNLSSGTISNLSQDDIVRIAKAGKRYSRHKRTAFTGSEDLEFGMFRMYESHAKREGIDIELKVFRLRDEAIEWLKEA